MLIIHSKDDASVEPLNCLLWDTFEVEWEKNSTYQITFTAYDDKSVGFEALDVEAEIDFNGQAFIVKTCEPTFSGSIFTKQITAVHIYTTCSRIMKIASTAASANYTPQQVLSYYFDNNAFGFTYQVIGNFSSIPIDSLSSGSAWDALSTIVDNWPDAIIFPDNKKIVVYQHDSFVKNLGNRISYKHDTSDITLTYDSTALTNKVWIIGAKKDDGTYYFPPQYVTIDDSISEWGTFEAPPISDDDYTDVNSMIAYAKTQLSPEPSFTVEITRMDNIQPTPGEIRHFQIPNTGLETEVEVVGYQYYPFNKTQFTVLDLANTAKTILDYQLNQKNLLKTIQQNQKAQIKSWVVGEVEDSDDN
ncbi:phage tail protein [Oenococcus oeni]